MVVGEGEFGENDGSDGSGSDPAAETGYCGADDVSRFLFRNAQQFDSNTLLSKTEVEEYILQATAEIDAHTRRSWRTNTVTDKFLNVVYSDKWRWHGDYVACFTLGRRPVLSVTKIEVITGGTYVDIVAAGAENRASTWYFDRDTGEVFIVGSQLPSVLRKGARVTYTWGHSYVPRNIKKAAIRIAAADLMESEAYAVDTPETSILGGLDSRIEAWRKYAYKILDMEMDMVYASG